MRKLAEAGGQRRNPKVFRKKSRFTGVGPLRVEVVVFDGGDESIDLVGVV